MAVCSIKTIILCIILGGVEGAGVYSQYHCEDGKDVMVQFFSWKYRDIALQCQDTQYFTPYYCAVQVPPPHEHQLKHLEIQGGPQPWWQRYGPISYNLLKSDSGTLEDFDFMVKQCNSYGIRVYVEVEINHMSDEDWGYGSAGNPYDGRYNRLTYPGVPFTKVDFHLPNDGCPTPDGYVFDPNDARQLRNCAWNGFRDLKTESSNVRSKLASYINQLLYLGVSGVRLAHAGFVEPPDIQAITGQLTSTTEGRRPFIYMEVQDTDVGPIRNADYVGIGRVEEARATSDIADVIRRVDGAKLSDLVQWGPQSGLLRSDDAIVSVSDPDAQRGWTLHEANSTLTFYEARDYLLANSFILAWPYGYPRVLSSFKWDRTLIRAQGETTDLANWEGPERYNNGTVKDAIVNRSDKHSCLNGWQCEHRQHVTLAMVWFHNKAGQKPTQNVWHNSKDQLAFSRGAKNSDCVAFIAINNEVNAHLDKTLNTGLPKGTYCDLMTGTEIKAPCKRGQRSVSVDRKGKAKIYIPKQDRNPVVAIIKP